MRPDTSVVVVAAGQGRRMGGQNKALLELDGESVLAHVLRSLRASQCCREIVVVMNPLDVEALLAKGYPSPSELGADKIVDGGAERWLSSRAGCLESSEQSEVLLVHDCARALVTPQTVDAVAHAAREHGAALAAEPLADTLKREAPGGRVAETLPREGLWRAQTPQGARRELLLSAFLSWEERGGALPTDEAMLLEAAGHAPLLVPSPASNFKLTTPHDLVLALALLRSR